MTRIILVVAVLVAASAGNAGAQRYRVLVGSENGQRNVIQFSPCIPAEGSGCGAWIDRESVPDTTSRLASATSAAFGRGDSVWIERGAIRIQGPGNQRKTISDPRGAAQALALAPLRDYAFVILRSPDAATSTVVMVDLSTRSVIANCPMPSRASSIAVMR